MRGPRGGVSAASRFVGCASWAAFLGSDLGDEVVLDVHLEVLDDRVGEQRLGHLADLGEYLLGDLAVEGELESLALTDVAHALEPQARQRTEHGLALRVEDLGLGHDVDDDTGHGELPGVGWTAAGESIREVIGNNRGMSQQPRNVSGLALEFPQSLAVYDDYASAQKAVDFLSDHHFPVQNCMIVGTELK
jgi:hypothetical protein